MTGIQALRGIAALMVVACHLGVTAGVSLPPFLSSGVDIFFVVSGFVMMALASHHSPLPFIRDRVIRIVPLYWVLTLAVCAIGHHSLQDLAKSLAFIPYHGARGMFPIIGPGWSLNIEMGFYLLFSLCLLLKDRRAMVIAMGAVLVPVALLHSHVEADSIASFYANSRLLEFLFGMVLGLAYLEGWLTRRRWAGVALIVTGFVLIAPLPALWGAPLIVGGAILAEGLPLPRILLVLGDASYSLYLTHVLTIEMLHRAWHERAPAIFFAATLVACIAAAVLCYNMIERPMIRLAKSIRWGRPQAAGTSSAVAVWPAVPAERP